MTNEELDICAQLADIPDTPPPESSLFWKLCRSCESIAESAYETKFLQQLQSGVLSADVYSAFMISDLWYCSKGPASYEHAIDRTEDPLLKAFLTEKRDVYKEFLEQFKTAWRVADPDAILPTGVAEKYAALEERVATDEDPIYTLIFMLPCEYLWPWLADKMKDHIENNVYGPWIRGNMGFKGAYKVGNFLQRFEENNVGMINHEKALDLYTQAMKMEMENFSSP